MKKKILFVIGSFLLGACILYVSTNQSLSAEDPVKALLNDDQKKLFDFEKQYDVAMESEISRIFPNGEFETYGYYYLSSENADKIEYVFVLEIEDNKTKELMTTLQILFGDKGVSFKKAKYKMKDLKQLQINLAEKLKNIDGFSSHIDLKSGKVVVEAYMEDSQKVELITTFGADMLDVINEDPQSSYHFPSGSNTRRENGGDLVQNQKKMEQINFYEFLPQSGKWTYKQQVEIYNEFALVKKPGEEVTMAVGLSEENKVKLDSNIIRFKLTERNADGTFVKLVDEQHVPIVKTGWDPRVTVKLPEKEGAHYFITGEVIVGGNVEDVVLNSYEVPIQQVNAEINLDKVAYPSSGSLTFTMVNSGPTSLFYGLNYKMERNENKTWVEVPLKRNQAISAIGLNLHVREIWEQTVTYKNLKPGTYRISKEVEGNGTSIEKVIYAEFKIKE
ncbi:hypothetical protein QFZ77_007520 [Paenibacillus sp. V4I3]|uniref:immunoglobulin-like domain-containing protein n=1 Tax=Paenibacillus sp. V4I3 TaxID=3042305 RepID=UPI00277D8F59|nr:immunoglobulin-like domain-containing protein [Paenibacillus sp. V4I3]MDQ0878861.1 hypothetical protein [Paenibacillus sp. V4I3]